MSLAWMAFVAALIALEKTLPWGRSVTYATAIVLLVLGAVLIAAPHAVPGLSVPGDGAGMTAWGMAPTQCRCAESGDNAGGGAGKHLSAAALVRRREGSGRMRRFAHGIQRFGRACKSCAR